MTSEGGMLKDAVRAPFAEGCRRMGWNDGERAKTSHLTMISRAV